MSRKRLWFVLKVVAAVAIVVGVGRQFARTLDNPELAVRSFALRVEFLLPAGLLYLLAHGCWATFWVRLLHSQGVRVPLHHGLRAYYVSQLGKYIPGKVWVIGIRMAMIGSSPRSRLAVGVTATYETLTSMGTGAMLGVLFLPWLGLMPDLISGNVVFLGAIAGLPLLLAVVNKLAARVAAKKRGPDAAPLPSPPLLLMAQGLLHGVAGWCLLAISLGLVIRAVVPDAPPLDKDAFLGNLAAVGLAYVIGFVVLVAPGGIGIREFILQSALSPRFAASADPGVAAALAVVVALVLRLVWSGIEVGVALALYAWRPAVPEPSTTAEKEGMHDGQR